MNSVTPSFPAFLENYLNLVARVDRLCSHILECAGSAVVCRKGCDACCRHLSLFPVEAMALRLALDTLPPGHRRRITDKARNATEEDCPLLDGGICLLYPHRPVICRTHGMPILMAPEGDDAPALDFCPLNFRGMEEMDRSMIIDLEQLNTALAAVNRIFTDQVLDQAELPERILLSDALLMELD